MAHRWHDVRFVRTALACAFHLALTIGAGGVLLAPRVARAQAAGATTAEQRLRQQQEELDKLRRERADLEARM